MLMWLVAGGAASAQTALPALEPGLWEIVVETTNPGDFRPTTDRLSRCLRDGDAALPRRQLPTRYDRETCRVTALRENGAKIVYSLICDQNRITSSGEFTFARSAYEGRILTEPLESEVNGLQIVQQVRARRMGDCPTPEGAGGGAVQSR